MRVENKYYKSGYFTSAFTRAHALSFKLYCVRVLTIRKKSVIIPASSFLKNTRRGIRWIETI